MSRTYRRKNSPFEETLEEYTTPDAWEIAGMTAEFGWGRGTICKNVDEYVEYWTVQYKRVITHYNHDMWGSTYKLKGCMKHEANRKRRTEERSKLRKSEYPEFKPFKRYSNIWDWD